MHGKPQKAALDETKEKSAELLKKERDDAKPKPRTPDRVYPPRPKR